MFPDSVCRVIDELAKLPGVGPRTAERLALHLARGAGRDARALAESILSMTERVAWCSRCFDLSETDPCPICDDVSRDRSRILVVEHPRDVQVLERTGYRGLYHVLQGRITPNAGSAGGAAALVEEALGALVSRVRRDGVREVILGTNPDLEGDGTALAVRKHLTVNLASDEPTASGRSPDGAPAGSEPSYPRITRLARGIPTGASLEHVNTAVLAEALNRRTALSASGEDAGSGQADRDDSSGTAGPIVRDLERGAHGGRSRTEADGA